MVTLRELPPAEGAFLGRTQTLSDEHAAALLKLEKRQGRAHWEIVPEEEVNRDSLPTVSEPDPSDPDAQPNADAQRSGSKKSGQQGAAAR